MADDSAASAGSVRGDAWVTVAAFLGALGVGFTFANLWGGFAGVMLLADTYWLSADPSWPRLIPALAVLTVMLAAVLTGRWGWVVACVGLALRFGLHEGDLVRSFGRSGTVLLLTVTGVVAVGGALAAFGLADRAGRLAIGAGLAFGAYGHLTLLDASLPASTAVTRLRLLIPLALCVVAAAVWLARGVGRAGPPGAAVESGAAEAPPARRSWATPGMAVGVALGATLLYLALMAVLDSLGRRGGSPRRLEAIELLYQVGLFGIVVTAGIALSIYAYRRGGSVSARWVLVGVATGLAGLFTPGGPTLYDPLGRPGAAVWLTIGVAAAGVLLGAGLSRFALVPWDGLGLVALAVGTVLRSPRGRIEFVEQDTNLRYFVVFTVAFVFAAALCALITQTSLRGIGGPGEVAALAGLGFVASLLTASLIFPASLLVDQRDGLGLGPAVAVGIMAVGALALYGLGLVARFFRRAIEAEARREAGLTSQ